LQVELHRPEKTLELNQTQLKTTGPLVAVASFWEFLQLLVAPIENLQRPAKDQLQPVFLTVYNMYFIYSDNKID
jgi:hypothetical protein